MPVNQEFKAKLLEEINLATFGIDDILLYLDTHPLDTAALAKYQEYKAMREKALSEYVCHFGPLTKFQVTSDSAWTWINEPWPWEGGAC